MLEQKKGKTLQAVNCHMFKIVVYISKEYLLHIYDFLVEEVFFSESAARLKICFPPFPYSNGDYVNMNKL